MVKVSITQTGTGKCALSSYEGEGLAVAFDSDQEPLFLTWRSFRQLLALRLAHGSKSPVAPLPKSMAPVPLTDTK